MSGSKCSLWRICANLLPTKERLQRVFQVGDGQCLLCTTEHESSFHLFVGCDIVQKLFFQSKWSLRVQKLGVVDVRDWISLIVGDGRLEGMVGERARDFTLFAVCAMDCIWAPRNKVRLSKGVVDIDKLTRSISREANLQKRLFDDSKVQTLVEERPMQPPPTGTFKIKIDTTVKVGVMVVAWVE